jgi:hypothetical protein
MEIKNTEPQKGNKRFVLLATLSIINIGFGIFDQLSAFIIGKLSPAQVEKVINQSKELTKSMKVENSSDIFEKMYAVQRIQNELFILSHGIALISLTIGLIGVLMMLNKKSIGFQLYIIYSILASFSIVLYVPFNSIPFPLLVVNTFLSIFLVFLYYANRIWNTTKE